MHAIRTWYLYERLVEAGIACVEPSGAFYAYPSFNRWQGPLADKGIDSSDDLAKHLLDEYELATLPGSVFGSPPADLSLRLSSSYLDTGTDAEAASLVNAFKEDPDPERFIENHHPELREVCTRLAEFAAVLEPNPDPRRLAGGPRS
jgi:hypothetical protein